MGKYIFFFIAALFVVAVFLRESFVFTLIYLLIGTFTLARWWGGRSFRSLSVRQQLPQRLFLGEKARGLVEIENRSRLPVVWLEIHQSLPTELAGPKPFHQIVSIGARGAFKYEYWLDARRRGYYSVGPLKLISGDVFGVTDQQQTSYPPQYLTVFPRIIPLTNVPILSRSPLGTLRHYQPVYEDPSRVVGKRDYTPGDSLRRIDWKASAASGRLQTKNYEPSISVQTQIVLNLNAMDYHPRRRFDDSELAIVVAASLANWIISRRQAAGLAVIGMDLLGIDGRPPTTPPRSGRGQLLRILEILARVESVETGSFVGLLQEARTGLSWGSTQIVVTPSVDEVLLDDLFQARRKGLSSIIVSIGALVGYRGLQEKARYFGFPLYNIQDQRDLDVWRRGRVNILHG